MAEALDDSALERWRADPASFIEECMVDPETGLPFKLLTPLPGGNVGRGRTRKSLRVKTLPPSMGGRDSLRAISDKKRNRREQPSQMRFLEMGSLFKAAEAGALGPKAVLRSIHTAGSNPTLSATQKISY
jgi:hypothetical protein